MADFAAFQTPAYNILMSTAPSRRLTEAEYLAIERRAPTKSEFYDGEMFAMAGAGRNHNLIVTNLIGELRQKLRKKPCEVYPSDMRVKVGGSGLYTYPDVVVMCGEPQFVDGEVDTLLNPTVLIEVLSESTASYVRGFKSRCYRKMASLRHFVIVDYEQPAIEHYRRAEDDNWEVTDASGLKATLQLQCLGCKLSLAAVYEKVKFPKNIEGPKPGPR